MAQFWSGHQVVDPTELEARFSNEDGIGYLESITEEPSEEALEKIKKVRVIMETLPDREADFVDLYFFKQIRQTGIADIFKVSQPTVCYRLQRATARIRFLLELPALIWEDFQRDVAVALPDFLDRRIMFLMYGTACQSEVAKILKVSQGLVRHRFIRSIVRLRDHADMGLYAKLFEAIASNLNIRREVQRSWEGRVSCVVA